MIEIEFHIYLASTTRWVHMVKLIEFAAVPRVGDFVKFQNGEVGDNYAWDVTDVTFREPGKIEVTMGLLNNVDDRWYSFEDEAEFNEYCNSYIAEGWSAPGGVSKNTRFVNRKKLDS